MSTNELIAVGIVAVVVMFYLFIEDNRKFPWEK
jgi:hypothetical protein